MHVVGRDDGCDTVLVGDEISRRHAELRVDGPVLAVRDLDSRNGVHVNGKKGSDVPLLVGDVLRLGEWVALVVDHEGAGIHEISRGWFGGKTLAAAVEPASRVAVGLPIIVQGETGTGKEGMARAIHEWSGRKGSFVAVNCAALPAHLAEAELFGYRKGAFTGADKASVGLFRAANSGTIFLDEILDLPPAIQPKLLRAIEQREVLALGETTPTPLDVRIVVASQEPLGAAVADRRFRADLYARLDGLTIVLPPLRERREDIVPLFREFLQQHAGDRPPALEAKLIESLLLYDWPLNVRELQFLARRLLDVHGHAGLLKKAHLPERMLSSPSANRDARFERPDTKKSLRRPTDDDVEFEKLVAALRDHDGNMARAAAAIGVSRARAYRLVAAHPEYSFESERNLS